MTPAELNEAKKQLGITWDELAKVLGMSRRTMYTRQSGFRPVRPLEAEKIRAMVEAKQAKKSKAKKR